jgi:zinc transport system substrate-binding protein
MRNKLILSIFVLLILAALGFFIFQNKPRQTATSGKLQVSTSFYPMYFLASQIGGDRAQVYNITPAGAEPHEYEPTAQDIARIETSNILILNGSSLETWGQKIKDDVQNKNVKVVIVGDKLATKDPHIWLDPLLFKQEAAKVEKTFVEADPANASFYQNNASQLETKLDNLNAQFEQGLKSCKKSDFVTSHAAFSYLAKRYNLKQIAIAGLSPEEDPSTKRLTQIADIVKQQNIKVIFFESLVSPKLAETIANETGAKTSVLDPIEGITDKQLNAGQNYFTVMQTNLKNLQSALDCTK